MTLQEKIAAVIERYIQENPDTKFAEVFGALQVSQMHWEYQFAKTQHARDQKTMKESQNVG